MEAKITSSVTELPNSCKSKMEHMVNELKKEDRQEQAYKIAEITSSCKTELDRLEQVLGKKLDKHISLVAYEEKNR